MQATNFNHQRRTGARVSSPSSGVRPGARALNLELPTSFGLRLFMVALCLLAGSLLFTHPAYAASYLNVSSTGSVAFGSIRPTSSGTSSTATDKLTVHTDCSVGYSVYVSGQNGKDTNLTNSSASSNNTIATSSNAIGSAGSLSVNTWGLNYENDGTYVGLPTYADATSKALTSKSNVEEASTVDIYYGLKVNTALTPGTYAGDVLYTVLPNSACSVYTVRFNANGGTGEMADQTINVGKATNLSANTFTRSGYTFLGWSTDSSATTATYIDKQPVTDLTDFNTTINLYAIWGPISGTMQSWTGCSSLTVGQSVFLTDTRDNKAYAIKKLPDSKCWMVQNLTIGTDGAKTLTASDTNIDDGKTYYLPPAGKQGSSAIDNSSTLAATDTANFVDDTTIDQHAKTQFRTKDISITNDSDTGYYNFYTATLGYSYFGSGSSGSSTRDICPKGWRLPHTTDNGLVISSIGITNDFTYLARLYGTDNWSGSTTGYDYVTDSSAVKNSIYLSDASPLATSSQNNYAGFSLSGEWAGENASATSLSGIYWTASVANSNYGYRLGFSVSSTVRPQFYNAKSAGYAVRCIAQNRYTINYNVNGASGSASKSTEGALYENNSITTATVGTMTKTGYHFLGWSTNSSATTATYEPGATVSVSALASATSATDGGTITLYAIWSPNTYTIAYNANGGSGTTSSQSVTYNSGNVTLRANNFSRSGYTFQGWSRNSGASNTVHYNANTSYSINTLASNTGVTNTNGGTINLYAVWKSSIVYMQDFTCSGSRLSTGQSTTLIDSRDNKSYIVKKLPDGKCWMMQNLTINGTTLTPNNTNIDNGTTYYLPKDGGSGDITSSSTTSSTSGYNFSSTGDNDDKAIFKFRSRNGNYANDSDTGYYNFFTATLGFSYTGDRISSGSSTRDICPRGWRLPKVSDNGNSIVASSNEFTILAKSYNSNASWAGDETSGGGGYYSSDETIKNSMYVDAASPLGVDAQNNYAGFSYAGRYKNTSLENGGTRGYYWSSSVYSVYSGYSLYFVAALVAPQDSNNFMSYGHAVRCVAKS